MYRPSLLYRTALGGYQSVNEYLVPGGRIYEQREYIYKAINDIPGLSAVKPKAAFYIFSEDRCEENFISMMMKSFALDFLREKKVLVTHGKGFNWDKPDHFRIVYLPRVEELKNSHRKTGRLFKDLSSVKQKKNREWNHAFFLKIIIRSEKRSMIFLREA